MRTLSIRNTKTNKSHKLSHISLKDNTKVNFKKADFLFLIQELVSKMLEFSAQGSSILIHSDRSGAIQTVTSQFYLNK